MVNQERLTEIYSDPPEDIRERLERAAVYIESKDQAAWHSGHRQGCPLA